MRFAQSPDSAERPPLKHLILAVAAGLLVVLVPLVVILLEPDPRLAATNTRVIASLNAVTLPAGTTRCQQGEYVPTSAAYLRLFTSTEGAAGQPLEIEIRAPRRRPAVARVRGGYPPGQLRVDLPARPTDLEAAQLCLRNLGAKSVFFAGNLTSSSPEGKAVNTPYQRPVDEIRADFFRAGEESWVGVAPAVAKRFALFKVSAFGPWTFWAALASMIALAGLACGLLVRALRS